MKTALHMFEEELDAIREAGTWREERIITTPQRSRIDTTQKPQVVNLCANNYLGLSDSPELIEAAKASYDKWGFGLSSVRFICGTQQIHKDLEARIANLKYPDAGFAPEVNARNLQQLRDFIGDFGGYITPEAERTPATQSGNEIDSLLELYR